MAGARRKAVKSRDAASRRAERLRWPSGQNPLASLLRNAFLGQATLISQQYWRASSLEQVQEGTDWLVAFSIPAAFQRQRRRHYCWVALQVSVTVPPVQDGTGGGAHEMAKVAEVLVAAV